MDDVGRYRGCARGRARLASYGQEWRDVKDAVQTRSRGRLCTILARRWLPSFGYSDGAFELKESAVDGDTGEVTFEWDQLLSATCSGLMRLILPLVSLHP